jgi:hypothetical protein
MINSQSASSSYGGGENELLFWMAHAFYKLNIPTSDVFYCFHFSTQARRLVYSYIIDCQRNGKIGMVELL